MKNAKKLIAALIAMAMVLGLMACGNNGEIEETSEAETTITTDAEKDGQLHGCAAGYHDLQFTSSYFADGNRLWFVVSYHCVRCKYASSEWYEKGLCIGTTTCSAYCSCNACCGQWAQAEVPTTASGTTATVGRTVAVDPSVIPFGTQLWIDGNIYTAEDCGSGVNGLWIDIYMASHEEALQYGLQQHEVYILD